MNATQLGVRRLGVFLGLLGLTASSAHGQAANVPTRITQAIDEKTLSPCGETSIRSPAQSLIRAPSPTPRL